MVLYHNNKPKIISYSIVVVSSIFTHWKELFLLSRTGKIKHSVELPYSIAERGRRSLLILGLEVCSQDK